MNLWMPMPILIIANQTKRVTAYASNEFVDSILASRNLTLVVPC